MAKNSSRNRKQKVSFVLSDKAKSIIENFENTLSKNNFNAIKKRSVRAKLVWELLSKIDSSKCSSVEKSTDINHLFEIIQKDGSLFDYVMLYLDAIIYTDEVIDTFQFEALCDEVYAVLDYYSFEIENSYAYASFFDKYSKLCHTLYGEQNNPVVISNEYGAYPLWSILVELNNKYIHSKGNSHIPNGIFDLAIIREDKDTADESKFFINGNCIQLRDFICDRLSEDGTLFYKSPDFCINKDAWLSFRKWVVDNRYLQGVIELPYGIEDGGQILIISKKKTDSIYFCDARHCKSEEKLDVKEILQIIQEKNEFCKVLSFEEFCSNNSQYYTFVKRQFAIAPRPQEGEVVVELRNLVDLYVSKIEEDIPCFFLNRPYYFGDRFGSVSFEPLEGAMMPQAKKVPNENFFLFKWDEYVSEYLCSYHAEMDSYETDWSCATGIHYSDLYDSDDKPVLCTYTDAIVFKLKDNPIVPVEPDYLANLLWSSNEVISQVEHFKLPYRDKSLEEEDFLSIKVVLPSLEKQQQSVNLIRQKDLVDTKEEIKKMFEAYKQDIRMKKHSLAQRLLIMKNWWQNLQMAREEGNGIVNDEAVIGKLHPVSVKEIYSQIDRGINMLFKQVNAFNLGDTMTPEVFDAKEFLQQYVMDHDPMFEFQCELTPAPAHIRFPKDALQIILDNIASNACSHGFKGREKESNVIRIVMEMKGHDMIVRVANNGKPMSPSLTAENVFTYGNTTEEGVGEHSGLGGFQVRDLMLKFGNDVELELDENAEFPVSYKLIFRDVNIY